MRNCWRFVNPTSGFGIVARMVAYSFAVNGGVGSWSDESIDSSCAVGLYARRISLLGWYSNSEKMRVAVPGGCGG
jgi:hypothetical protein